MKSQVALRGDHFSEHGQHGLVAKVTDKVQKLQRKGTAIGEPNVLRPVLRQQDRNACVVLLRQELGQ